MNARLRLKLIHSQKTVRKPVPKPPAPLRLLGDGLDAIIQHTVRPTEGWLRNVVAGTNDPSLPWEPTPEERLKRYHVAVGLHPLPDRDFAERRAMLGELILTAWLRGERPRIRHGCLLIAAALSRRRNAA